MARKNRSTNSKKSQIKKSYSPRRVDLSNTRRSLHRVPIKPQLTEIQDGRFYSPLKKELRPLLDIMGSPAQIKAIPLLKKYSPQALFQVDNSALLCARRAIRKEVIFSLGRGGSKVKKPKYQTNSKINCRRK